MKIALGKRESLHVHMTWIVGRLEIFLILFKSLCNMHSKFAIHHTMSFCHMALTEHKCAGIQVMCLLGRGLAQIARHNMGGNMGLWARRQG